MLKAIITDSIFTLILCVIIAAGTLFCEKKNTLAVEQAIYDNWTYNTDVDVPDGFSKAMYSPPKERIKYENMDIRLCVPYNGNYKSWGQYGELLCLPP